MRLYFILIVIFSLFLTTACTTTTPALDQNASISIPMEGESITENNADLQSVSQLEPVSDIWELSICVHESLPEFKLMLQGDQDTYTALSIINTSTGALVYRDDLTERGGIVKDRFAVDAVDIDFDGYNDIDIFTGYSGTWKTDHLYIIWDCVTANFIEDIYGLGSLGLPRFDADKKLIYSMQRGSAADHWFYTHQYIDGMLVTIQEESFNLVWEYYLDDPVKEQLKTLEPLYDGDQTSFMHYMKKQLDYEIMELVIVEDQYMLNQRGGDTLVEYSPDSEVSLLLKSYER